MSKLFLPLLVFFTLISCSTKHTTPLPPQFNPDRIQEAEYKLIMYNQGENKISSIGILDRKVEFFEFDSIPAIKISELYTNGVTKNKTITFINKETLKPMYLEETRNDTLLSKSHFNKKTIQKYEFNSEEVIENELPNYSDSFASNSFSEIIQGYNFNIYEKVEFKTFRPGSIPGLFIVERIGQEDFDLPSEGKLQTWLLKFTRIDENGEEVPAGFRYIDKESGKVLRFKTEIESDTYFTYQIIFMK